MKLIEAEKKRWAVKMNKLPSESEKKRNVNSEKLGFPRSHNTSRENRYYLDALN